MTDLRLTGFDPERIRRSVVTPTLDSLRARARRRRTRNRIAAVGLLMVAVAAPGLAATVGRQPDPPPARPAATHLAYWDGQVTVGYRADHDSCEFEFTRSDDGGATWSAPAGPDTRAYCLRDVDGSVVSRTQVHVLTPDVYLVGVGATDHVSTDAGRTWSDTTATALTVAAFPPWAVPVNCLTPCPDLRPPVAVDPVAGRLYRLADPPTEMGLVYVTADGVIWTAGGAADGDGTALAVSTDRGATWQVTTGLAGVVDGLAARDANEAFVLTSAFGGDATARSTLWRTADGGQGWHDQPTSLPTVTAGALTIGDRGQLLVGHHGTHDILTWTSTDDGVTFTAGTPTPPGSIGALPGRMWTSGGGLPTPGQVTVDGTVWQSVPLPTQ